jgi:acyl-CoA reductase-like NAD-dependent aldehyde dehydrogenase
VILEDCCADRVKEEFRKQGAYLLCKEEAAKVAAILLRPNGTMNPKVVGKTASQVAAMAGLNIPENTTVLVAHETEAGPTRPYSREKLCPILALFVERNEDTILKRAVEVLLGEGAGHTFSIHATEEGVIRRFAMEIPVSRFLVNTPSSLGGIGATTKLFPALTLGCGAVGGSSSSNNISPMDLINLRRVAWGEASVEEPDAALIAELTREILNQLRRNGQ